MDKATRISGYIMYGLMILSAIFTVLVLFGGVVEGDPLETPTYSDIIIRFAYVLIIGSIATALGFELFKIVLQPSSAKKTLLILVGLFAFIFVSYLFADGTPMEIIGYDGEDNIPSMLKITDTGLFICYVLMVAAAISIVSAEVVNIFKS